MSFTSLFFVIFCICAALVYFVIPNKVKWIALLMISMGFYCTWGIEKVPFILVASCIAWLTGCSIGQRYEKCGKKASDLSTEDAKALNLKTKKSNKVIVIIAILSLLAMLIYVKAGKMIIGAFTGNVSIIVPLGISYYTFSLIGYLADCYWKKEKAETNYFKLLLFTAYFPKVVQGPISKHRVVDEV